MTAAWAVARVPSRGTGSPVGQLSKHGFDAHPPTLLAFKVCSERILHTREARRIMAIKFKGVDYLQFDGLLSDDERLVRDTARKFIEDNLVPIIEECNRAGRFPRELVRPMGELGFYGASLKGYGCAGMSNVEYGLVMQELERGVSGVRSFVSVQSALVMYPIFAFGSGEQKQTWLPALQKGEKLGCFGLTEPDFGSNPGGMRSRARKVGSEYVINGEKM